MTIFKNFVDAPNKSGHDVTRKNEGYLTQRDKPSPSLRITGSSPVLTTLCWADRTQRDNLLMALSVVEPFLGEYGEMILLT